MNNKDLKPVLILAPMYHVTDVVFRQIIEDCAPPDIFVTEFVNVDGLQSVGRPRLLPYLYQSQSSTPLWAQIWGHQPENYYKTALELAQRGFAGIDLNMGCPDKTVLKNNACAALIKSENRSYVSQIIQATKEGAQGIPVSVKTRLGVKVIDLSWHEFLLKQDLAYLTVHGRTVAQKSQTPADWSMIAKIKKMAQKINPKTKIIGNGDITSYRQALDLCQTYVWDGAMIGRGIFNDPFVFSANSPWPNFSTLDKVKLYHRHLSLFLKTYPNNERAFAPLKKFMKVYLTGFSGATALRQQIALTGDIVSALRILDTFLKNLKN